MAIKKAKDGKTWMYDIRDPQGNRIRKKGFPTKKDAEDAVAVRKTKWLRQKHDLPTTKKLYINLPEELRKEAQYLRSLVKDYKTKHHNFAAITLEKYADLLPNKLNLLEFGKKHLDQIHQLEQERGLKVHSINLYLRYLKSAITRIKKRNADLLDDWRIPEGFYLNNTKIARQKVIANWEIKKILGILDNPPREANIMYNTASMWKDAADVMRIGMLSGMRKSEIISLEWNSIHFEMGFLRVKTLKQKNEEKWREVPLVGELLEMFERRKESVKTEKGGDRFVFPRWITDKQSQWLYRALKKACELAEIPYGSRLVDGVFPHATRHTAATQMLTNGVDLKTASEILGHSPEMLLRQYAHSNMDLKRSALANLSINR